MDVASSDQVDFPEARSGGYWDGLVLRLQAYREGVGRPSYQMLADRVAQARVDRGVDPYAARVGKSTVYNCFQTGRPRPNVDLICEVARVMGATEEQVDEWVRACHRPVPSVVIEPEAEATEAVRDTSTREVLWLMLGCVVFNLLGREFVDFFKFPVHLDMIGTAIAAIALGPWRGAAVGLATNAIGVIGSGWISLPFALVNIAGAVMWGYGVRHWRLGRTLPRFFLLNVMTAVACAVVAVPIILAFVQGNRVGHDVFTQLVEDAIPLHAVAVGFSNLVTSGLDKLISGFVALVAVSALPFHMRHTIPLILADHRPSEPTE